MLAGDGVAQPDAGDASLVAAQHLLDHRVGDELDVVLRTGVVDHDLGGAELVAAVHQRHVGRELGQEAGLLHRAVAAADHNHLLAAEEGRVADRAVADAHPLQLLLAGDTDLARGGAGGHDHAAGEVLLVAHVHLQGVAREVDAGDVVGHQLGAEPLGLLAHGRHQLRAQDAVLEAGVVLDVARDHQLTAVGEALEHQRVQVGARGIEGRRVAGRASADDDHFADLAHRSPVLHAPRSCHPDAFVSSLISTFDTRKHSPQRSQQNPPPSMRAPKKLPSGWPQ